MKNILKKSLLIMLAVAMVLSCAACGGSGSNKGGSGAAGTGGVDISKYGAELPILDTNAVISNMPSDLKGTTIKFYNWYDPYEREEGNVIKAFEEATGIKVELVQGGSYENYNAYLAGLMATGDAPDVMRLKQNTPSQLQVLQPIDVTGFDFSDPAWDKTTMDLYSLNGKCYGVNLSYTPFFLPVVCFYNSKVMDEFGYEDPYKLWQKGEWTWDKLKEMCTDWCKQGTDYVGCYLLPFTAVGLTAGVDAVKFENNTYSSNITDATYLNTWKFTLEGVKGNIFGGNESNFELANPTQLFAFMDATAVQTSSSYFSKTKRRGNCQVVAAPKWSGTDYTVPMIEYLAFGVPQGAKNPKAVPYFLSYYLNFANYNTEGTNFFYNEQAKDVYLELLTMKKRLLNTGSYIFSTLANIDWDIYNHCDPAQLSTFLNERAYKINDSINQQNDIINNMK